MAKHNEKAALLSQLAQAYGPQGWQGPTVLSVLRGLGARTALKRPHAGRHTIWELVLHLAFWTHQARVRVSGVRTPFPRSPRNWPAQPRRADERAWRADVALLKAEHRALVRAVTALRSREFTKRVGPWTKSETIAGLALHDMYHAGQIGYLRKVLRA